MNRRRCLAGLVTLALLPGRRVASATSLPAAPLPLLGGGVLDLATLRGQVVVFRFLASW